MTGARDPRVGLCATCVHARVVETPRARYWRCALSAADPRFEKYPRLPVLRCGGYEEGARPGGDEAEGSG